MSIVKQQNHNVYIHAYKKSPMGVWSACAKDVQKKYDLGHDKFGVSK